MDSSKRKPLITKQQMMANDEENKREIKNGKRPNVMITKTPVKNKSPSKQEEEEMTPEKSMAKNIKLDNNELPNTVKVRIDGTKSLVKCKTSTENYFEKMKSKTPASKRELKFATTAKYNPRMETGIPLIKPKPTTKIVPFKFSTTERSKKKPK